MLQTEQDRFAAILQTCRQQHLDLLKLDREQTLRHYAQIVTDSQNSFDRVMLQTIERLNEIQVATTKKATSSWWAALISISSLVIIIAALNYYLVALQ
jgi:hypothetical protein